MVSFPKTEAEVVGLAQVMTTGLSEHSDVYPAPPVVPLSLKALWTAVVDAKAAAASAQAQAEAATMAKLEAIEALVAAMKKNIRYAENTVNFEDDKLKLIGWGAPTPHGPVCPPGQPRDLVVDHQGEGTVDLSWRKPVQRSGGALRAYLVLRREKTNGDWTAWTEIATPMEAEAHLQNQPTGTKLEYCVVAVNTSGSSLPSNTVAVVL